MSVESKNYDILSLIFSEHLNFVLLKDNKLKLDGFLYPIETKSEIIDEVFLSKKVSEDTGLKIEPGKWRKVVTLQNIQKIWRIDIVMAVTDLSKRKESSDVIVPINDLPDNCHPNIKWIIPLCLDPTVYGSIFNQILMK